MEENFNLNEQRINSTFEDDFWSLVNNLNWFENTNSNNEDAMEYVSNYLNENYDLDEMASFQRIEVDKRIAMENFIKSYINTAPKEDRNRFTLDDEGIFYLASHIVGLGKTMYGYVRKHPEILFTLQNEYTKCFEDAFDNAMYDYYYTYQVD